MASTSSNNYYNYAPTARNVTEKDGESDTGIPIMSDVWTPKAWQPVLHRDWCYEKTKPTNPGLIYIKVPKTSSSTLAGINNQLARKIGSQVLVKLHEEDIETPGGISPVRGICSHSDQHRNARRKIRNRQKTATVSNNSMDTDAERNPLIWTFLRDPATRHISEFFHYKVSHRHVPFTPQELLESLQSSKNFMYNYIRQEKSLIDWGEEISNSNVSLPSSLPTWYVVQQTAIEPYNFIGLLERREESLAVMKLLWNVTTSDLIVLPAKFSGGYDAGGHNKTCVLIQRAPRTLPPRVSSFINNGFRQDNWDYLLYSMVNAMLDSTIQALGVDRVEREVKQLRRYQHIAEESCLQEAVFPCSSNGTRQLEAAKESCYVKDSGCGHACVDRVLASV